MTRLVLVATLGDAASKHVVGDALNLVLVPLLRARLVGVVLHQRVHGGKRQLGRGQQGAAQFQEDQALQRRQRGVVVGCHQHFLGSGCFSGLGWDPASLYKPQERGVCPGCMTVAYGAGSQASQQRCLPTPKIMFLSRKILWG